MLKIIKSNVENGYNLKILNMFIFLSLQLYNLMNSLLLNLYLSRSSVSKFIISNEVKMFINFYKQYNLFLVQ